MFFGVVVGSFPLTVAGTAMGNWRYTRPLGQPTEALRGNDPR